MLENIAIPLTAPPLRPPRLRRYRILIAALVFVAWVFITGWNPVPRLHGAGYLDLLAGGVEWGILAAGLFLLLVLGIFRWRNIGLGLAPARSLLLLWFPGIYLLLFFAGDAALGFPAPVTTGLLLLNAALAAFSEELMFRGVVFGALRSRLRPGIAILLTTLLFGLTHLLNAAAIGNVELAGAQAVAAAMSGTLFIALRVRTGSLLPGMALHAVWDFGILVLAAGLMAKAGASGAGSGAAAGAPSVLELLVPIILLLPNFLYALFLLRRTGRDKPEISTSRPDPVGT